MFVASRDQLVGRDTVVLDGAEGHHAAVVRRLNVGEAIQLVDGSGLRVTGAVAEVHRNAIVIDVRDRIEEPAAQPRLVVVQALAKGPRGDRAVEAMTEVGVDEIVPWAAARSIAKWRDAKPLERWRATAREAAKQARRSWLPVVSEPVDLQGAAARLTNAALAVVCHESAVAPLSEVAVPAAGDIVVVVGPEGGITDDELTAFAASGAAPYGLGPTVLRADTAGTVAAALLLSRTHRWK